ncbi:hypothetical protein GF389_05515 [Candidatus Dojkabacteria bacterium]|nr:hypothetical protein [Candidatus Dojkabacteria bacterium]
MKNSWKISENNLKELPLVPGCYIYRDKNGKVLYVGKAVNLRARVNSYFAKLGDERLKIQDMIRQADTVEVITVDSEAEALILETNLIKKYKPKYNARSKDDKNYVWVMFEKGVDFPRPKIVREKRVKNADYFGPYPKSFPAKQVLHQLRQLFPYCVTNFRVDREVNDIGVKRSVKVRGAEKRPCLDYYTGFCSGVCTGLFTKTEHKRNISHIKKFFRGEKREMYEELEREMKKASKEKDYEKAAAIRDKLQNLIYVTQGIKVRSTTDESAVQKAAKSYLKEAEGQLISKAKLKIPEGKNSYRIECYDISNIQGKQATGSMVVFVDGKADKSQYRKFRIRSKDTPDDFFMMQETLKRRFKRAIDNDKKFLPLPDLIIIDGGKGQLSSAFQVLKEFDLDYEIEILGLAKREEELFRIIEEESNEVQSDGINYRYGKNRDERELKNEHMHEREDNELKRKRTDNDGIAGKEVKIDKELRFDKKISKEPNSYSFSKTTLPRRSKALYLVQRIRDEAHRFAIGYHRNLREKNSIRSTLSEIPGVGKLTEKKLIKAFGSLDKIKKASTRELQTVVRNGKTVEAIQKLL